MGKGIQRAWESIAELFVLAVNPAPSEWLRNTCAGTSKTTIWCEAIAVREISEGHLEIVVGKKKMARPALPRVGVVYGTFPDNSMRYIDLSRRMPISLLVLLGLHPVLVLGDMCFDAVHSVCFRG
jgi:hypothetical protein